MWQYIVLITEGNLVATGAVIFALVLCFVYFLMAVATPIHNLLKHDNAVGWEWGETFRWMHKEDYEGNSKGGS